MLIFFDEAQKHNFYWAGIQLVLGNPYISHRHLTSIGTRELTLAITGSLSEQSFSQDNYVKLYGQENNAANNDNDHIKRPHAIQQLVGVISKMTVNTLFQELFPAQLRPNCFMTEPGRQRTGLSLKQRKALRSLEKSLISSKDSSDNKFTLLSAEEYYMDSTPRNKWRRIALYEQKGHVNGSHDDKWSWVFYPSGKEDLKNSDKRRSEVIGSTSLIGSHLRVVTVEEEPFIIRKTSSDWEKELFDGYCIDVLNAIQTEVAASSSSQEQRGRDTKERSFTYSVYTVADGQYGVYSEEEGGWTGVVGDLLKGKADIAVAGMIRNYDREKVVDFVASHMDYGVSILIRRPIGGGGHNLFGFLAPLAPSVWICICLTGFFTALVLFALARYSPNSVNNRTSSDKKKECLFPDTIWFVLSSFMQQGIDSQPAQIPNRILVSFWYFFALIIVATYTANLAAFLTVTRMDHEIRGLSDLANQKEIQYGTVDKSTLQQFFREVKLDLPSTTNTDFF
ncbi:glutamate receptor ionotropic, kainate 2-like [Convolutriloba macropyga]|uniref:glutamate receptor ionotropic, kainate 2-like n=1 Tax=Convolutriloba macropyga TaxID=536237 RepID=UPI003F51DCA0